jgi:predicted nucleotide-binding protein
MLERFTGATGERNLLDALASNEVVCGDTAAAQALANSGSLEEIGAGEFLIRQGGADNHILFICAGRVEILVNDRRVAIRAAGQTVGEMALIDPSAMRSAGVRALETTVVLQVSEPAFAATAQARPDLWRRLARQLANRLRQRNSLVRPTNPIPRLFIGSSVEGLPVARELQSALAHDNVLANIWTDGIFGPSRFTIEDLERELESSDFACLVLTPDDVILSREQDRPAPRDNVVFELGLFMGVAGRQRTLLVVPRDTEIKIPTDLLGLKPISYVSAVGASLAARIAPAASEVRKVVTALGAR